MMTIRNLSNILFLLLCAWLLNGCTDKPRGSQRDEQFAIVKQSVKSTLGDEYQALNFKVKRERFTNDDKSEYEIDYTFDLNKPFLMFDGKNIPAKLSFIKESDGWICNFNSANVAGFFNLLNK